MMNPPKEAQRLSLNDYQSIVTTMRAKLAERLGMLFDSFPVSTNSFLVLPICSTYRMSLKSMTPAEQLSSYSATPRLTCTKLWSGLVRYITAPETDVAPRPWDAWSLGAQYPLPSTESESRPQSANRTDRRRCTGWITGWSYSAGLSAAGTAKVVLVTSGISSPTPTFDTFSVASQNGSVSSSLLSFLSKT